MVVEKMRVLAKQDPTLVWLPVALSERFDIMIERGARYNGHGSSVLDQIFNLNDQSAYHKMADPMNRLKNICPRTITMLSDADLHQLPEDATNYGDMWKCCRLQQQYYANQA